MLLSSLAFFALLLLVASGRAVILPSFMLGIQPVSLLIFTPVPVAAALVMCLNSRHATAEVISIRPIQLMDVGLSLAAVVSAMGISCAVGLALDLGEVIAVGRNTTFLVGLAMAVRTWAAQPAVFAPVAWIMVVIFFGLRSGGDPYPWTILPEPLGSAHAAIAAGLVFLAGVVTQLVISPRIDQ
ncbi:hypothetical protein ACGFY7_33445 [Streptomyces prunicolor]|uniref:hypothetical protein n=1 Tax=Streptomyces prunicolor TaxID=67348 RepID=UPI00371BC573